MYSPSSRLIAAAAALVVFTACGGTNSGATPSAGPARASLKIMVGGLNKQIYLPNMLTKRLGYFDEQNLDVTFVDEGSGQATEEEVIAGNADAGSGSYNHTIEVQPLGKNIETVCQFGIAPGEAEMIASGKASSMTGPADLKGKTLGVTSIGSGTHTLSLAIMGKAGLKGTDAKFIGVGAGDTFIAAIKQGKIDGGMTTEPTISRLLQSGDGKVLVDLRTPEATRAALGGDYPFIGMFMSNSYVNSHKDAVQRMVNAYVKTLKFMNTHTATEIADKMPSEYYAGDKNLYVAALESQKKIFGTDCKMPKGGPETVLKIQQDYVAAFAGKTADLSKTYTNEFANNAKS